MKYIIRAIGWLILLAPFLVLFAGFIYLGGTELGIALVGGMIAFMIWLFVGVNLIFYRMDDKGEEIETLREELLEVKRDVNNKDAYMRMRMDSMEEAQEKRQKEFLLATEKAGKTKETKPGKKALVLRWRDDHPQGTKAECVADTGISKSTVSKYWAIWNKKDAIESESAPQENE